MDLTVTDLGAARGGRPVLEGVSFRLSPGQALILRGPNGAGKTTLLRTLAGLQPPLWGKIDGGEDRIAYAAHADGIKPTLTVAENLTFWAQVFAQDGILRAVEAFHLTDLADRPAGSLSAGQKRRLGLARLLVTGRPIWILDEPTVSLDRKSVAQFEAIIADHLGQGGSVLMATHIDPGFEATTFDVTPYRARPEIAVGSDEAFL